MKTRRLTSTAIIAVAALALVAACALAACAGSDETAATAATAPTASPMIVPATEPESQLDGPGDATLAQTRTLAKRYAAAVTGEKITGAGLYSADATWDYWPGDTHIQGGGNIEAMYADAATYCDWSKSHALTAPGVVVYEGVFTVHDEGKVALPALALLSVDGDKVVHEEVFFAPGAESKRAVTFCLTGAGPKDTPGVAAKVGTAVGDAFAGGDTTALRPLLAPDILFYDTGLRHGIRGVQAVLDWQSRTPSLEISNQPPMAGRGWACLRWTVRRAYSTGTEVAMPGATVMEIRDGKVVRMTLYYDSELIGLQD